MNEPERSDRDTVLVERSYLTRTVQVYRLPRDVWESESDDVALDELACNQGELVSEHVVLLDDDDLEHAHEIEVLR